MSHRDQQNPNWSNISLTSSFTTTTENQNHQYETCSANINSCFDVVYKQEFNITASNVSDNNSYNQAKIDIAINKLNSNEKLKSFIKETVLPGFALSLSSNPQVFNKFLGEVIKDLKPNILEYGREFISTYHDKRDVYHAMEKVLRGIFVDSTSSLVTNCVKHFTSAWTPFIHQTFGIIFPTFWELLMDYIYPPSDPDPIYWANIIYLLIMALLQFILLFLLNACYAYGILTSTSLRFGLSMVINCIVAWLKRQKPVK